MKAFTLKTKHFCPRLTTAPCTCTCTRTLLLMPICTCARTSSDAYFHLYKNILTDAYLLLTRHVLISPQHLHVHKNTVPDAYLPTQKKTHYKCILAHAFKCSICNSVHYQMSTCMIQKMSNRLILRALCTMYHLHRCTKYNSICKHEL